MGKKKKQKILKKKRQKPKNNKKIKSLSSWKPTPLEKKSDEELMSLLKEEWLKNPQQELFMELMKEKPDYEYAFELVARRKEYLKVQRSRHEESVSWHRDLLGPALCIDVEPLVLQGSFKRKLKESSENATPV